MRNKTKYRLITIAAGAIAILISICLEVKSFGGERLILSQTSIGFLPETAEILFVSNRDTGSRRKEIYAMDANGEGTTRLTFTNRHHFIVGIDRRRRYIVASCAEADTTKPSGLGDEDKRSLWLLDLKSKKEMRLTNLRNHAEGNSFSPDGEWIVFHMKVKGEEQSDIYKIRRDGSHLKKLTDTKTKIEADPEWSNDGTRILFTCLDGLKSNPRYLLKVMDIDGKDIETIYDGGKGVVIGGGIFPPGNYDPSWSPDDQWIVFERAIEDTGGNWGSGIWHIFKVGKDGGKLVDLSLAGAHTRSAEYLPSFSSDGQFIVFGSLHEAKDPKKSHNDIFLMNASGKSLKRLTEDPASDMFPVWIPSEE